MAGETEVGGRGETMPNDTEVRRFKENAYSAEGALADMYAKEHLLLMYCLPDPVKRRVRALKKLQVCTFQMEADFQNEVHDLEMKYYKQYKDIYDLRAKIINGKHEPSDEELYKDDMDLNDLSPEIKAKLKAEKLDMPSGPGIPNFWLTIFKNVTLLNDLTYPNDYDILKHLIDIKVVLMKQPMGFKLEFYFEPNEYFSNKVLTKVYEMKCSPNEEDPFSFEGPEIRKSIGCTIDWYENKNVTIKTVNKKQKHKTKGSVRSVSATVKNDSFFNFFTPPKVPEDIELNNEELQMEITADFEVGHYLRERIVPQAVLYFTGEGLEDDESFEDEEDESGSSPSSSAEDDDSASGSEPNETE